MPALARPSNRPGWGIPRRCRGWTGDHPGENATCCQQDKGKPCRGSEASCPACGPFGLGQDLSLLEFRRGFNRDRSGVKCGEKSCAVRRALCWVFLQ